jgi:nucleoside-diphosphate-sugar epimerase
MRLLILGGTAFLGRATAVLADAAGHEVTCAARGKTGSAPPGIRFVPIDRDYDESGPARTAPRPDPDRSPDGLAALGAERFDAVIDVARRPSHVRGALAALAGRVGHWVFVSTASVYADNATVGQRAATAPILEPAPPGIDDPSAEGAAEYYGPCKVSCEQAVIEGVGPERAFICRAGLIVGPEDRSGRFTYWVERLARGGEVLAPGRSDEPVQWVDVRDLAAWLVRAAEKGISGVYDGIGAPVGRAEFLAGVARGLSTEPKLTWVEQEFLIEQGVQPWSGDRSLPMWLPLPEYAGFLSRDVSDALAAGLVTRDVADTARATHQWLISADQAGGDGGFRTGLRAEEEAELLARYAERKG